MKHVTQHPQIQVLLNTLNLFSDRAETNPADVQCETEPGESSIEQSRPEVLLGPEQNLIWGPQLNPTQPSS